MSEIGRTPSPGDGRKVDGQEQVWTGEAWLPLSGRVQSPRYPCCDHCRSEEGGCDWLDRHHAPCGMCAARCQCRNPVGLRCNWDATRQDGLCDACRLGKPVMGDGKHWCQSASTDLTAPARGSS